MNSGLWNMSGDIGNYYTLALIGLIVGLLLTLGSAIALIFAFSSKSRIAEESLAAAVALQEKTKLEATRANERIAELLRRAKQEELQREQAQAKTEIVKRDPSRHVTDAQREMIIKAVQGQSFPISMLYDNGDQEAARFSEELAKTLTDAGLQVTRKSSLFQIQAQGIGLSMSHINGVGFLYAALRNAGYSTSDLQEKDPPMIVIGKNPSAAKHPPQP